MELLDCLAGLPGEDGVLVGQFLDSEALGVGVGAVDLVPEQFRDALPVLACLVAEALVFLAQELTFDAERSAV
jgi:hypothetical protein